MRVNNEAIKYFLHSLVSFLFFFPFIFCCCRVMIQPSANTWVYRIHSSTAAAVFECFLFLRFTYLLRLLLLCNRLNSASHHCL